MTARPACAICGRPAAATGAGVRAPVAAVRQFVDERGLGGRALCGSCAYGAAPSPCVSLCTLDDGRRQCRGCGRTVTEIAGWREMATAERLAVLLRLRSLS